MKNSELISLLQALPQDMEVHYGWESVTSIVKYAAIEDVQGVGHVIVLDEEPPKDDPSGEVKAVRYG